MGGGVCCYGCENMAKIVNFEGILKLENSVWYGRSTIFWVFIQ